MNIIINITMAYTIKLFARKRMYALYFSQRSKYVLQTIEIILCVSICAS